MYALDSATMRVLQWTSYSAIALQCTHYSAVTLQCTRYNARAGTEHEQLQSYPQLETNVVLQCNYETIHASYSLSSTAIRPSRT